MAKTKFTAISFDEEEEKKKKEAAAKVTAKDVAEKFNVQLPTTSAGSKTASGASTVSTAASAKTQAASSLYRQMVEELVAGDKLYAAQGPEYTRDLANSIISGAVTSPGKGNVGKLDLNAIHNMTLANADIASKLSQTGIFNTREFATNPYYAHLPTQEYRESLLPTLKAELEESQQADAAHEAALTEYKTNLAGIRAQQADAAEKAAQWKNFFSLVGEDPTMEDKLRAAGIATGETYDISVFAGMDKFTAYEKMKELDEWYAGLDAAALSAAPTVEEPRAPQYESKTSALQSEINTLEEQINAWQRLGELEAIARSNPNYAMDSVYTAPDYSDISMWEQMLMPQMGGAYADNALYTYINTQQVDPYFSQSQGSADYYKNWEELGYDYLLDGNKADYNSLREMDPALAEEFLKNLSMVQLLPTRAQGYKSWDETVATNGWTALPAWAGSVVRGVGNILDVPRQAAEAIVGIDSPYSAAFDNLNRQQNTRGAQTEVIRGMEAPDWVKKAAEYAYQGVSGAADNTARLVASGFNPTASLIAAGMQSGSGSLYESAGRSDMSGAAKITKAILTAAAEVGTEKIGLDALFADGKDGAFKYIKNVMLSELGEETLNAATEPVIEGVVSFLYNYQADIESAPEFFADLGETAITTLISAALMGGGGAVSQSLDNRATGKVIQQQGDPEKILEIAKGMPETSETYAVAKDIEGQIGKEKKLPLGQFGKLVKTMNSELSQEYGDVTNKVMDEAIEARLVEVGSSPEAAKKNAPAIRKVAFGEKLTMAERAAVAWDDNADQVTKELSREMKEGKVKVEGAPTAAPEGQRAGQKWVTNMKAAQIDATGEVVGKQLQLRGAATTKNVSQTVKEATAKGAAKVRKGKDGKAAGKPTARKIAFDDGSAKGEGDILRFEEQDGELKMIVQTETQGEDGKKQKTEQAVSLDSLVEAEGAGTAGIIEAVNDINKTLHPVSAEEASTLLASYNTTGGDVGTFVENYERAYLAGYSGMDSQQVAIDPGLAKMAREAGARQEEKDENQRKQRASAYKAVDNPTAGWLGKVSSNADVRGRGDAEAIAGAMEAMTESQRITAETAIELGTAVGLNVVLFESDANSIGSIQNGSFDSMYHTVYLDVNSGAASGQDIQEQKENGTLGYAIMRTMGHELTHYLEAASPEMYGQYKATVRAGLKAAGEDMAVLIRQKIDNAMNEGRKLSYAGAEAEVIADASEYMLQDSKFTTDMDNTLRGKVKTFIQNFVQKVKDIFANLTGGHRESKALRELVDGVYCYTGKLQELWDASLQEVLDKGAEDLSVDTTEMVEGLEPVRQFSMDRNEEVTYASSEDVDFHRDGRIYDYDFMVAQKPISVVTIPSVDTLMSNGRFSRSEVVETGKGGIPGTENEEGHKKVTNVYTGRALTITNNSIRHGLNGKKQRLLANAQIGMVIGDVVKNGIPVNGLIPTDENALQTYAMVTPCITEDGKQMMAVTHVDIQKNEVSSVTFTDIVHSANGRIYKNSEPVSDTIDVEGKGPYHPSRYTISISDLLRDVNMSFKSLLSKDVLEHLEEERPENGTYSDKVLYSTRDQTDTEEFKRWFGNSKVVDEDGTPKVMYHGTPAENGEFWAFDYSKAKKLGRRGKKALGKGNYFSATNKGNASKYGSRVIEAYLSIQNPFVVRDGGAYFAERNIQTEEGYDQLQQEMRDQGYDGVIVYGDDGEIRYAVTFDSTQIKSATNNVGTFDPQNPDIRYSTRDLPDGNQYVHVDTDQHIFDNVPVSEYSKTARNYIRDHFRNKVIGNQVRAYVRRESENEYTLPAKKNIDPEVFQSKMRAATELDNLLDASTYMGHEDDDGRHPEAVRGWDKYRTVFEVEDRFFEGTVTLKLIKQGDVFYDVTNIKDITQPMRAKYSDVLQYPGQSDVADSIVRSSDENVNGEIKYSTSDNADRIAKMNAVEGVQFSIRDSSGEEIILSAQELEDNKKTVSSMRNVSAANGNNFVDLSPSEYRNKVKEYFAKVGASVENPVLGTVRITSEGLKHLTKFRSQVKSIAIPCVKDVIQNGLIVDIQENREGKPATVMFAAPVTLNGEMYYMGVTVRQANNGDNFYYLHEAAIATIHESDHPTTRTGPLQAIRLPDDHSHPYSILESIRKYNRKSAGFENTEEGVQYSTRDLPTDVTVRDFISEAGDDAASTIEEKNALQIYRGKLDAYREATNEAEAAETALKAVRTMAQDAEREGTANTRAKGAIKAEWVPKIEKAQRRVDVARVKQRQAYNKLVAIEETPHVQSVFGWARQFLTESLAGTPEEIETLKVETDKLLAEMEAQYEAMKAAGRTQAASESKRRAELYRRMAKAFRSDAAERVKETKRQFKEREQRAREYRRTRDEVAKMRRGISRKVKRLNTLRVRETDQKHVPQELKHVADEVMRVFTDSSLSSLAFSAKRTASLRRTYGILAELEEDWAYYWDDELEKTIDNLEALSEQYAALKNKETELDRFTLEGKALEMEILKGVDNIVSGVMNMIDSTNEDFLKDRNDTFNEFAKKAGEKLLARKNHKVLKGWLGKIQTMLDESLRTGNTTPIYYFEHLGNQEMLDVFNEVRQGQSYYAQIVAEGKDFVQTAKEKHNYGKWVNDGKLKMKTSQGHQIELTREEAAEIYAIAKREAANKLYQTEHLLYGGFQFKNIAEKVSEDGKTQQTDTPHQLDKADLEKIGNWLTEEQKAYADELVGFLSTTMADYGNAASMDMYGYNKFTESYYIPFNTVADQRFQRGDEGPQGENAGTGRAKNAGFTKKLQYKANQPLVVQGLTDTVAEHIHEMASYAAMVQPIENMKRLLNYKVLEKDGTSNTVRALIGQKYGKASEDYMTQLLKDMNGATQSDQRATTLTDKLVKAFKGGAVMASFSVFLQQPTAMARAMAYISPKYFMQNPFYRPSKGTWNEVMQYAGTAIIKDMGKFDVGMGLTASQYIADENINMIEAYRRLKGESKTKAGKAAYDRFMNWLTAAPGVADQWTWGLIWKAVKAEQKAMNPGMDVNSEAFLQLCGQRFDDVIDHSQVYDSVLTRSNLMRSQNGFHKMATSFMAEPTLSLNMLYDALTGKHSGKQRAAIIGSVAASQVLAGALAALVQAWNDDDDKRNWLEKYADSATGNTLDNLNPLGMIPYVSDIVSLFEGYDVERPDMSVIADVYDYSKTFFKAFEDGGTPSWKQIENFAGTLANLVGVPAKNISREIRRTRNAILNTEWSTPDAFNVGHAMLENTFWYSEKNTAYYQRMVTAHLNGDAELEEDFRTYMLTSKMVSEESMQNGLQTAMQERYLDGDVDDDTAIKYLVQIGKAEDEEEAYWTVDKWQYMKDTGNTAQSYRKYTEFFDAVESGEKLKATIQTYMDNGVSKTTLATQITNQYKDTLVSLWKSGKKTEFANLQARILTAYEALGYDRQKKLKDIQKWLEEDKK